MLNYRPQKPKARGFVCNPRALRSNQYRPLRGETPASLLHALETGDTLRQAGHARTTGLLIQTGRQYCL
jgi:hypothetical protein